MEDVRPASSTEERATLFVRMAEKKGHTKGKTAFDSTLELVTLYGSL